MRGICRPFSEQFWYVIQIFETVANIIGAQSTSLQLESLSCDDWRKCSWHQVGTFLIYQRLSGGLHSATAFCGACLSFRFMMQLYLSCKQLSNWYLSQINYVVGQTHLNDQLGTLFFCFSFQFYLSLRLLFKRHFDSPKLFAKDTRVPVTLTSQS